MYQLNRERNIEVLVRDRESITKQDVTSSDVIIAAGGGPLQYLID